MDAPITVKEEVWDIPKLLLAQANQTYNLTLKAVGEWLSGWVDDGYRTRFNSPKHIEELIKALKQGKFPGGE